MYITCTFILQLQKLLEEELPDDLLETSEEEEDLTFHSSNEHLGNVHPSQHQFSSSVNNQMTFTSFHPRMNSHTLSNRNDIFHPVVNNEIVETLQSNYSPVSIQPNSLPQDHITYQQQDRNGLSDVYKGTNQSLPQDHITYQQQDINGLSDVYKGTNQSLPQDHITYPQQDINGLSDVYKGTNQSLPQDYITYQQQDRNGLSDVFKGTSQEYSTVMENTHVSIHVY